MFKSVCYITIACFYYHVLSLFKEEYYSMEDLYPYAAMIVDCELNKLSHSAITTLRYAFMDIIHLHMEKALPKKECKEKC